MLNNEPCAKPLGAVLLVLQDGRPVYERSFGWADKESSRKMTPDALFRIASQSKALTATAVMILMEEGKLLITDPVSNYVPSFAKTSVVVKSEQGIEIVPAKRQITIRDVLTHTAGISLEMIRRGGELEGVRIIAPNTAALMTINAVGTLHSAGMPGGLGYSLAFETTEAFGGNGLSNAGAYGWGGAYGSVYRVDPIDKLTMIFMMQLMPNRTDLREKFPNLVYQALVR